MQDNKLFFLDTNILIYYYDKNENIKKIKAESLINQCWNRKIKLVISNQVLSEFVSVALHKLKLSVDEVYFVVKDIISFTGFIKIFYYDKSILSALEISKDFNLSFWDALIAATMKENNILNIYTENVKDFKIPWINTVNPVNS
ncbi:PIN domain-containing protein [Candidatus Pacearchaeota archaeon]|nr:PIN domain-containing protein [Candidatus Pacearchaeota archaeon]